MTNLEEAYNLITRGRDEPDMMVFLTYDNYLDACCVLGIEPEVVYSIEEE